MVGGLVEQKKRAKFLVSAVLLAVIPAAIFAADGTSRQTAAQAEDKATRATGAVQSEAVSSDPKTATGDSGDKLVLLKDGSRLIGYTTSNKDRVEVVCPCGRIVVARSEVKSVLPAPKKVDLEELTTGRCLVKFANGREVRSDAEIRDEKISLVDESKQQTISLDRVSKVIRLGEPKKTWTAKKAQYCVVTLNNGSVLRGKISSDKAGGAENPLVLQANFGVVRLANADVFCFETVESVFVNKKVVETQDATATTEKPAEKAKSGDSKTTQIASSSDDGAKAASKNDVTVYVTKNGRKYHREGCMFLKKSKIPMPLGKAAGKFEPCKTCNPPR